METSALDRFLGLFARFTTRFRVWHGWPFPIAAATLDGLRVNLRTRNLHDTETADRPVPEPGVDVRQERTADGSHNDLDKPWMGMAGARFGRNFPLTECFGCEGDRLLKPSPRRISNELLARREFVPVPHLNVLVSGWLQFMVHDWLSHGASTKEDPHRVPLEEGDDWHVDPMIILRDIPDATGPGDAGRPLTYTNTETHWWDGSQIYGSTLKRQQLVRRDWATGGVRDDGKITLTDTGNLPICPAEDDVGDAAGGKFADQELAGVSGNWWIALSVFHTLFAREHNAIVDRLRVDYPHQSGEWLFQKARLVNAALMAKIHTTEWTPALMNSPIGRFVMRSNWWGIAGEHFSRGYGRLGTDDVISGIMGAPTAHHGAPYAMTEEFVACYRMHSLIPDEFSFRRSSDDAELFRTDMAGASHGEVAGLYPKAGGLANVIYSLATEHPGALVLHNFPNFLRKLPVNPAKGIYNDLAAIDVLRDRERGIPRYCAFRRMLGMSVPRSFEELTTNPEWRKEVAAVYDNVEDVDVLVGTLCESVGGTPVGFGFSDTVFRIFILMASRRLKSDRFYTTDFTPEVYTPAGFTWVEDNSLRTVLERHCPELAPSLADARNPFFPWTRGTAA
jgi:hypothetical protein